MGLSTTILTPQEHVPATPTLLRQIRAITTTPPLRPTTTMQDRDREPTITMVPIKIRIPLRNQTIRTKTATVATISIPIVREHVRAPHPLHPPTHRLLIHPHPMADLITVVAAEVMAVVAEATAAVPAAAVAAVVAEEEAVQECDNPFPFKIYKLFPGKPTYHPRKELSKSSFNKPKNII